MIGRKRQQAELQAARQSEYSEFVAVYGRRRVGKTFLIRETFGYSFTFEHAGVANGGLREQLSAWKSSLADAGFFADKSPADWFEAFDLLKEVVRRAPEGKKVIFIDEMPWMDTAHGHFVSALEFFWNNWASGRKDILLIVCGSATSWIVNNIFKNHGGLHNRVTHRIFVEPFTLAECEEYAQSRGLAMTRYDILEGYMAMGGVPFYWSLLEKGLSLDQNIDNLFFSRSGKLRYEFDELYHSLFRSAEKYIAAVTALAGNRPGLVRNEIAAQGNIPNNGALTQVLEDLEHCGFIAKYNAFGKQKNNAFFQLIDPFTLFYFKFMRQDGQSSEHFWSGSRNTPLRNAWEGLAFERVCFLHLPQIKSALGISGVVTTVNSWQCAADGDGNPGAQIDMLIDRADNVVNICEMKFSHAPFVIGKDIAEQLQHKLDCFAQRTKTRKAIHLTMVTVYGVAQNAYWNLVQNSITADELFKP